MNNALIRHGDYLLIFYFGDRRELLTPIPYVQIIIGLAVWLPELLRTRHK